MDILKTIAFDITRSVFNNDTEGMMYVTKDIMTINLLFPCQSFRFPERQGNSYRNGL